MYRVNTSMIRLLAKARLVAMLSTMSLAEVEKEALALSENERAQLAAKLLETLPGEVEMSDKEVLLRDAELESGRAEESRLRQGPLRHRILRPRQQEGRDFHIPAG
jgi:hypothetical protein